MRIEIELLRLLRQSWHSHGGVVTLVAKNLIDVGKGTIINRVRTVDKSQLMRDSDKLIAPRGGNSIVHVGKDFYMDGH